MIAWIDLETTGLDENVDLPLEIAGIVTDDSLNIVGEREALIPWMPLTIDALLTAGDGFVKRMHIESGLLDDLAKLARLTARERELRRRAVENYFRDFFAANGARDVVLAGNTISFDRRFLRKYLPDLHEVFHYRSIDVSSINELARRWAPSVFANRPKQEGTKHRALADIRASIETLRYYRDCGFVGVDVGVPYRTFERGA